MSLSDSELASRAGIPTPVVKAIRAVESSGNPRAVRFETRLFRERTGTTIEGHSRTEFEQAFRQNPQAAVESTSFGLYQVLGSALIRLYGTPQAGVAAFDADPRTVSDRLLAEWFRSRPAAKTAANSGDYRELARLYNGSATSPWYGRFMAALESVGGAAAGGAFLGVVAIGLGALLAWKLTKRKKGRGFGELGEEEQALVRRVKPRAGRRPSQIAEFEVEVRRECMVDRTTGYPYCDVFAEGYSLEGGRLGSIEAVQDGRNLTIQYANTALGAGEGTGVGTRLYEALADYACTAGVKLRSDVSLTEMSRGFWEKQKRKGRAFFDHSEGRYVLKPSCRSRADLSGLAAPRGYIRKPKKTGLTPEEEKAFWESVKGDGVYSQSVVDAIVTEHLPAARAAVIPKRSAAEEKDASFRKMEQEFWSSVKPARSSSPAPSHETEKQRARRLETEKLVAYHERERAKAVAVGDKVRAQYHSKYLWQFKRTADRKVEDAYFAARKAAGKGLLR